MSIFDYMILASVAMLFAFAVRSVLEKKKTGHLSCTSCTGRCGMCKGCSTGADREKKTEK